MQNPRSQSKLFKAFVLSWTLVWSSLFSASKHEKCTNIRSMPFCLLHVNYVELLSLQDLISMHLATFNQLYEHKFRTWVSRDSCNLFSYLLRKKGGKKTSHHSVYHFSKISGRLRRTETENVSKYTNFIASNTLMFYTYN